MSPFPQPGVGLGPAGPSIQEGLARLAQALGDPDETQRQAVVRHVLASCLPVVLTGLGDRLVGMLNAPDEVTRRQARASLGELGPRVLASLSLGLSRGGEP